MNLYTRQRYVLNQYSNHTAIYLVGEANRLESTCYDPCDVRDRISYLIRSGFDPAHIRVQQVRKCTVYPPKTQFHIADKTTRRDLPSVLCERWVRQFKEEHPW